MDAYIETVRFNVALTCASSTLNRSTDIGRQKERTLHAALKYYLEPDDAFHEVRTGRYIADIHKDGSITEIQTRQFHMLRSKLAAFLAEYNVTVVFPVAQTKWLSWVDDTTGETTKKRKSPKTGQPLEVMAELYKLGDIIGHPNFSLRIIMLGIHEYRCLNGWSADKKKGSHRLERIPEGIYSEILLQNPNDYMRLLPADLPEIFTVSDLSKKARVTPRLAQTALLVLYRMGAVCRNGRIGRKYAYSLPE